MELDLVGTQERQAGRGGPEAAGVYTFLYGIWNVNNQLWKGFFLHKETVSSVKRVEFASHKIWLILRDRLCNNFCQD
jgi:hypothetical protein